LLTGDGAMTRLLMLG